MGWESVKRHAAGQTSRYTIEKTIQKTILSEQVESESPVSQKGEFTMYRLKRAAMLATLAVVALALTATAQTRPNFAGSWKLNVGKSDFGPLPPPDSETHTVIQTDAGLRDAVIADTQQGKQDYTITYNFDGSETVNTP